MPDTVIRTRLGDEFSVEQENYTGGGYSWETESDPEYLSLKDHIVDPGSTGPIGGGGCERFMFLALKKGTTKITFRLRRVWEARPERIAEYQIIVE
jgi:predicted secreted protein